MKLFHGTAGAVAGIVTERGLHPADEAGILLTPSFEEAQEFAAVPTAALIADGCEDTNGLIVQVKVKRARLTPDPVLEGCWRCKRPIGTDSITGFTLLEASEICADPIRVAAAAELMELWEPWREAEGGLPRL